MSYLQLIILVDWMFQLRCWAVDKYYALLCCVSDKA
jgi:hypothetical protein